MSNKHHKNIKRNTVGGGLCIDPGHRHREENGDRFSRVIQLEENLQANGRHEEEIQDPDAAHRVEWEADAPVR